MIGRLKIGKLSIVGVIRYRWEKKENPLDNYTMWRDWKIAIWFKKSKAVGSKNFKNPSKWSENLRNTYMIGFDFLFVMMWIDVDYGAMHLGV